MKIVPLSKARTGPARPSISERNFDFPAGAGSVVRAIFSKVKDDLSRYLRIAEKQQVVITRHGKPAGVLIGFESEDDWFDYKLGNDRRFLRRIESARRNLTAGLGVPLDNLDRAM